MPNLARTSLRALESVRSSRSLESDLQVPNSRIPRTQQRSAGQCRGSCTHCRFLLCNPLTEAEAQHAGAFLEHWHQAGYSSFCGSRSGSQ